MKRVDPKRCAISVLSTLGVAIGALVGCYSGLGGAAAVDSPEVEMSRSTPIAFLNVNVLPMDRERVLADQAVLVQEGRIVSIGPTGSMSVPEGAARVDGAGKYLMPGLAEMHAHIPPLEAGPAVERTLILYLAGGVTTVRGMLGDPSHLELRERTARGETLGPRIFTSGPSFNGNSAPTPEVAVRMVREQQQAGYDLLKIHPGLTRATFDAVAATAAEIGVPFAGHVPVDVGLHRALQVRQSTIDHLDGYMEALAGVPPGTNAGFFGFDAARQADLSQLGPLVAATRAAGVWNVPTQSLIEHLLGEDPPESLAARSEMRYMPAATVQQWLQTTNNLRSAEGATPERRRQFVDIRRQLIRTLHREGAGLLLGSDAPQVFNVPGFAVHHELRMLVESGLSPYQALAAGTRNPAVFFDELDHSGSVSVGRRADLLLLDANPLVDIGNVSRIAGVMVNGRWLPRAELDRRLQDAHCEARPTEC